MALSKVGITQRLAAAGIPSLLRDALFKLFARVSDDLTNVTASTYTVLEDDKTITLNSASGIAVTLPLATGSGRRLDFVIGTTITSNTTTLTCAGSDKLQGYAFFISDNGAAEMVGFAAVAGTSTVVTLNGTTKGGYAGMTITLRDVASARWQVEVRGAATGTEATPFS